jgi:hypothetical protein
VWEKKKKKTRVRDAFRHRLRHGSPAHNNHPPTPARFVTSGGWFRCRSVDLAARTCTAWQFISRRLASITARAGNY